MLRMEVYPYFYFWWYGYSDGTADEFSGRVTIITTRIGVS